MNRFFILFCAITIVIPIHFLLADQEYSDNAQHYVNQEYGIVEQIYKSDNNNPWIYLLRDAHFNVDAQHNISAILNQLADNNRIDSIYMEGSTGQIDTTIFSKYPHAQTRDEVANYLLNKSYINGVEYFAATSDSHLIPEGIEDPNTYTENLVYLQQAIDNQVCYQSLTDQILDFVHNNKKCIESSELIDFENWRSLYQRDKLTLARLCENISDKANIDLTSYPNISLLIKADRLSQKIDQKILSIEETRALSYLTGKISDSDLEHLFEQRVASHIGENNLNIFYQNLLNHLNAKSNTREQFNYIALYANILSMQTNINFKALNNERHSLEQAYINLFAKTDKGKNIYQLEQCSILLEKFFNLTMNADEARQLLYNQDDYTIDHLSDLARIVNPDMPFIPEDSYEAYSNALQTVSRFYRLAIERDTILARNTLDKMNCTNAKSAVVFTGGFHTPGMIEYFSRHNINVAVIQPVIPSFTGSSQSLNYSDSFIKTQTSIEAFIDRVINAIAIPRWLSSTPVGISENKKNIKMIETASYLMSLHAEHILQGDRHKASSDVIEIVNTALKMTGTDRLHDISLHAIRRYAQYREYELRIHGEPLFFYFTNRNDDFLWKTVTDDIQTIFADPTLFTDTLLMSVAKSPVELIAVPARTPEDILSDDFIAWAQDQSLSEAQKTQLLLPPPAVITVTRDDDTLNISLVSLDRESKDKNVVYQDQIPDSNISSDFIMRLTQSIRTTFAPRFSISPRIIVITPDTSSADVIDGNNPSLFAQQINPLKSHLRKKFSEEEDFSDFPFDTTSAEQQSITNEQLVDKFMRHAQRQNSFSAIISLAEKASNKRLLTILSSPEFYEAMKNTFSLFTQKQIRTISNDIIYNLLLNKATPPAALINILQRENFNSMITQRLFLPSFKNNPLYTIVHHKSANAPVLDLLADRIVEITGQHHSFITKSLSAVNRYIPIYRLMNLATTRILLRLNILPHFISDFLRSTFARLAAFDIIAHQSVHGDTIKKLYTDSKDKKIALAIAKSIYPVLVADFPDKTVRKEIINNNHTQIDILLGYLNQYNTPAIHSLLIKKLAQHPQLTKRTIDELSDYASDKPSIMITLFETLHILRQSSSDKDFIDQNLQSLWELIQSNYPDFKKQEKVDFTKTLLAISNPLADLRHSMDTTLRSLGIMNDQLALMISESENPVNAVTIEAMVEKYSQTNTFNEDVLTAIAQRQDLTIHIASILESINNRALIQALLTNERVMPIFEDNDLHKLSERQIPVHIDHNEFLAYLETHKKDITYLRAMAKKSTLTPHALIFLHSIADPRIYSEFAVKPDLPVGIAEILAKDSHPIAKALLVLNPITPPHVIQTIAQEALWQSTNIFTGMLPEEVDYFLKRFPNLSKDDQLLKLVLRHSAILMSRHIVEAYNSRGLSQPICKLISQLSLEVSIQSQADEEEKAFKKIAPFLFEGMIMHEFIDDATFYRHLTDAKLNRLHADLAPVGALIHFANAMYAFSRSVEQTYPDRAKHALRLAREIYEYSYTHKNNPAAKLALQQLNTTGTVPREILGLHNIAQIMVLDLNNAQPFTEEGFDEILRFYRIRYEQFSYEKRLLITLSTLMLRDAINQRLISSNTALALLNDCIETGFSIDNWMQTKHKLLNNLVRSSNLTAKMKDDLLTQQPDLTEFFIRRGARGIMDYQRYRRFYDNIIIENMPEYLHSDMAKTIWFELMNANENQLFVEPHYVTHLQLIRHNGEVIITKDSFKISFPVIDLLDVSPNISTIQAEIGHLIDFALFRDTDTWSSVYFAPFGEFQDRTAVQSIPSQLNDPMESQPIIELYTQYDNKLIELFQLFTQRAAEQKKTIVNYLSDLYFPFEPEGLKERFLSQGTYQILYESRNIHALSASEQRLIGEFLFYAAKNDQSLTEQIKQIRAIRSDIDALPWNIKSFFEGGVYLSTYASAYDQVLPPLHPLFGMYAPSILDTLEEHIGGEWLSFYFRTRVRELLRSGQLSPQSLPQFYRTAVYYLRTLTYKNGRPNGRVVVESINNLTPTALFNDIQKRSIKGKTVSSSIDTVAQPTDIAAPEKMVFNAFSRVLNHLFFNEVITFEQLDAVGNYFVKSVYPQYTKKSIDAAQDLTRNPAFLATCVDIVYGELQHVLTSSSNLKEQLLSITQQPFREMIPDSGPQKQNIASDQNTGNILAETVESNPSVAALIDNALQTTNVLRDSSHVVIDFDNVFHTTNPIYQKELLMAFRLMFHTSFTLENDQKAMKEQAQHIIFYSQSQSQEDLAASLTATGLDPNLFVLIGKDAPGLKQLGLKKYLGINNQISPANTIFLATPESHYISSQLLMDKALVFNMGASHDFHSFGINLRVLFDLLRYNVVPNNMEITTFETHSTMPIGQLITQTDTTSLDFNSLAGMIITMPVQDDQSQRPRLFSLPANQRLVDEAL